LVLKPYSGRGSTGRKEKKTEGQIENERFRKNQTKKGEHYPEKRKKVGRGHHQKGREGKIPAKPVWNPKEVPHFQGPEGDTRPGNDQMTGSKKKAPPQS